VCLSPQAPAQTGEELYFEICTQCHDDWAHDEPQRSYKSWELTVYRMQSYSYFTDEQADKIINYLANLGSEEDQPQQNEVATTVADDETDASESPAALTQAQEERRAREERFRRTRQIAQARIWNPSAAWLAGARYLGYAGVAALVGLALTGLLRRRMRRRFRLVHTALAVTLLLAIAAHALIDLAEYGAPPVLWLWFGIAASVLPAVGLATGYTRRILGRAFRPVHYGFASAGLALAVLHWIWVYI
jgi:hypothetical protein